MKLINADRLTIVLTDMLQMSTCPIEEEALEKAIDAVDKMPPVDAVRREDYEALREDYNEIFHMRRWRG